MQNKIVELHKTVCCCKTKAKALKIHISTIRAIIKRFQSTKDVTNLPGRGRVYIVLMYGEEESLSGQRLSKDHSWRIAESSWVSGSENLKKKKRSNSPYISTCCSGGFQEKWSSLIQKQTPAYSVIRHDWNFKWHWLLWSDETEKIAFLPQIHFMGLVQTGIKKYPMSTVKYTAGSLMLWPVFLLEVLNILFRCMASWILSNTNR